MNPDSGRFQSKLLFVVGGIAYAQFCFFHHVGLQHHLKLKPMCKRLVDAGKPKKVALITCMRMQLSILNIMMKKNTYWNENMA
ncbi:hypothetical protein GCM10027180_35910 [Microbulbifer echini]